VKAAQAPGQTAARPIDPTWSLCGHSTARVGQSISQRPRRMARALFATALAQALVAVIAMIAWKQYLELSILNGFFIALWIGSALLFRKAARVSPKSRTV
jgi:type IV secretory pathway TrbD component